MLAFHCYGCTLIRGEQNTSTLPCVFSEFTGPGQEMARTSWHGANGRSSVMEMALEGVKGRAGRIETFSLLHPVALLLLRVQTAIGALRGPLSNLVRQRIVCIEH